MIVSGQGGPRKRGLEVGFVYYPFISFQYLSAGTGFGKIPVRGDLVG
jgi:hypothetical protein